MIYILMEVLCDVNYNWWGSNFVGSNPVTAGRIVGATVSKWLVLTTTCRSGHH